ncbi:Uncharacterized protein APZ42_031811 [Daphnia magna]|uniref:Uncharacterized protein n=1 Tax=Daphnia magna TaxID=35525 RepID=A0A164MIE6_9CRUS|nr:Uncharacterized protein APZ42_031811 [Daphnia magna]
MDDHFVSCGGKVFHQGIYYIYALHFMDLKTFPLLCNLSVPVPDENDCESSDENEEPLSDDEADFGENIDNCDAEEIDDSTADDSIALN